MNILIADAVIIEDGKVLLVQQRKTSAYGLWGLPGGHIEPGETPKEAVLREVQEELGLPLLDHKPLAIFHTEGQSGTLEVHSFTGCISGTIRIPEDELLAYQWFEIDEVAKLGKALRNDIILQQIAAALAT